MLKSLSCLHLTKKKVKSTLKHSDGHSCIQQKIFNNKNEDKSMYVGKSFLYNRQKHKIVID